MYKIVYFRSVLRTNVTVIEPYFRSFLESDYAFCVYFAMYWVLIPF